MKNEESIERWAADMLTVLVVSENGPEHDLWVMLHHLFSAVKMFDLMDDRNKTIVEDLVKKTRSMFESKFSLKKRKMKTTKKEKNPPTPLRKRKEKDKEKEEENHIYAERKNSEVLDERRAAFRQECLQFTSKYDSQLVADFFHYWAEENETTGKMRYEEQRSWNLDYRLSRWVNNHIAADNANAAIRLRKTKAREAEATAAADQLTAAAALREQENARREAEREESRRMAGGLTETMNANPNGILARIARERQAREARIVNSE
jgi:hypothetical protein